MPARMTEADLRRAGIDLPKAAKKKRTKKPPPAINWRAFGLPDPVTEYRFCERRWRFDFAWVEHKVCLEQEGGLWVRGRHNRPKGMMNDMQKYNRAAVLGWTVIRCTPQQLKSGEIVATLREALGCS